VATIAEVRTGLAARLATITGLRVYPVWPDSLNTPAAIVRPTSHDFGDDFSDDATIHIEIILLAAAIGPGIAAAEATLDLYLAATGSQSIKQAIEGDVTLGDKVDSTRVIGWRDYGPIEESGLLFLGCRVDIEVLS
jgi:hypothetical protein